MYNGKSLSMKAEVGSLSRNIKIQGDEYSEIDQFGAFVLVSG